MTRFNEFYDFAFPRVYRFARRRMQNEAQAQALCRLVLTRALAVPGGLDVFEFRVRRDAQDFAYWLYCLSRQTADQLSSQIAEHPELFLPTDLEGDLEDETLEILRAARSTPPRPR